MSFPPGFSNIITPAEVLAGQDPDYHQDWMEIPATKVYTNVFVWEEQEGKILLGYKKRGFGKGLYNGFGGKVEPGETIAQAALRELEEEAGIRANLIHCGTLLFFAQGDSYAHLVEVFHAAATTISGVPTESEEMRPGWYALKPLDYFRTESFNSNFKEAAAAIETGLPSVPFDRMWADVPLWFPLMLSQKRFIGRVDFAKFTDEPSDAKMLKWWIGTIINDD